MDKKTRIIRGPQGNKMVIPKPASGFTQAEKEHVILEYLSGTSNKNEICQKYTGKQNHGKMFVWMRKLGYHTDQVKPRKINPSSKSALMPQEKQTSFIPPKQENLSQNLPSRLIKYA